MESQDKAERVPVGYVGCEDLQGFVSALLDQYEGVYQLSRHDEAIPQNEIFIKVGGDHGGDSFKFMLQVGNVKTPNFKKKVFAGSSQRQRFSQKRMEGGEVIQTETWQSEQNDMEGKADRI